MMSAFLKGGTYDTASIITSDSIFWLKKTHYINYIKEAVVHSLRSPNGWGGTILHTYVKNSTLRSFKSHVKVFKLYN